MTTEPDSERPSLAEIVREMTNDGLDILKFLLQAARGELQDSETKHRLEAAHTLLDFFIGYALLRRSPPDSALAIVLSNDLDIFREVVRLQVDAVEGRFEDVAVRQRVVLAEQLRICLRLASSADAAPAGLVGAGFSTVLQSETNCGSAIERFLSDVADGKIPDATPDDARNARKLLES